MGEALGLPFFEPQRLTVSQPELTGPFRDISKEVPHQDLGLQNHVTV